MEYSASLNRYEAPRTFIELSENDKIYHFQNYLNTLAQLQSVGVEMKMEINAVTRALNDIMGIVVIQPVRR
ncbi:hypothetical protein [Paenibacillus rigui]|uniref:Uncharacterized protein n=1 Tax=Paenibacillus rigui TaxID=554312 RepID=A0A229UKQ3_9BACL|nr:hypothetical protein [Paenibacillus rigui]OXM83976.1 hypothetical protein CF651_22965 [Paenibacillus rigui]